MAKKTSSNKNVSNLNIMNLKVEEYSILVGLLFSLIFLLSVISLANRELTDIKAYGSLMRGAPNNLAAVLAIALTFYGLLKAKKMWHKLAVTVSFAVLFSAYSVYIFALS
mgnify:CR=1 FL=1